MAKWGEGDPRWIVEERDDGTNVNNWHWTEKNAAAWSKEKLKSLLEGFVVEDDTYFCEIKELTCTGDATANNRKGKLIFFYEWDIKGDWKGHTKGSSTSYKGKFDIPNLSEENDASDIEFNVTTSSDKDEAYKVKEFLRKSGLKRIQEQMDTYIKHLKEEYSQGMVLPAKNAANKTAKNGESANVNTVRKEMEKTVINKTPKAASNSLGVKIKCRSIKAKVEFKCAATELYMTLTEIDRVRAFTHNSVQKFEAEKGGEFILFSGNVQGTFTQLDRDKKICMRWRNKSWPEEHYSEVTLTLSENEGQTSLQLNQTGVPESEYDRTYEGWSRYYWDSIKQIFGYGTRLF